VPQATCLISAATKKLSLQQLHEFLGLNPTDGLSIIDSLNIMNNQITRNFSS
jgi:hypothetical protein